MLQLEEKNALRARLQDDLLSLTGGSLPDHIFESLLDYVVGEVRPDWISRRVDWDKLPSNVRKDLREALEKEDHVMPDEVSILTPNEVFERWMEWNGMINWSGTVQNVLDGIRAASYPSDSRKDSAGLSPSSEDV